MVCHDQESFLPGVNSSTLGTFLENTFHVNGDQEHMGRHLTGWYLQQVIKLGAAQAIANLTEYFVVWDLDMIMLRPVSVLLRPSRRDAAPTSYRTLVNVGGSHAPGYITSYRKLFRDGLAMAPDGSSFVTHWMAVYKPYMQEMLLTLQMDSPQSPGGDDSPMSWVWIILKAVDQAQVQQGFSEYASYVSFVKRHYPESQYIVTRRTWLRHPAGQSFIAALRHLHPRRCCCPPNWLLNFLKVAGYTYTGYEVGHIAACGYTDPIHNHGYCLNSRDMEGLVESSITQE